MPIAISGRAAVREATELVGAVEVLDDGQMLLAVVVWFHAERAVRESEDLDAARLQQSEDGDGNE